MINDIKTCNKIELLEKEKIFNKKLKKIEIENAQINETNKKIIHNLNNNLTKIIED